MSIPGRTCSDVRVEGSCKEPQRYTSADVRLRCERCVVLVPFALLCGVQQRGPFLSTAGLHAFASCGRDYCVWWCGAGIMNMGK